MDETLPARDQSDLDDLRHHWGDAYDIRTDGETWTASRRDRPCELLTGDSAAELRTLVRALWPASATPAGRLLRRRAR